MNKNEKFVITINRELGSGGRTVGEKLAAKLGVPFYDKAVIEGLKAKYNLTVEEIEKLKGQKQNWWSDFKRKMGFDDTASAKFYHSSMGQAPELLTSEEMFQTEKEILKAIAADESCVIAGRSGFYVFDKIPNHLSVFIQASMEHRIQRVVRKDDVTPEEAKKTIEKVDKMRENYVNRYANTSRYDTRNYDLVISMDGKTEDEIADLILKYIE